MHPSLALRVLIHSAKVLTLGESQHPVDSAPWVIDSAPCCFCRLSNLGEREFCIDNLLLRIHFIIEMIWWTGLASWEFDRPRAMGV